MPMESEGQRASEVQSSDTDADRAAPAAGPADAPKGHKSCRIIAIGASAGGLEPFETFFENVSTDTGFAFVVIQHLSPHFRSMMDELLDRRSSMRIRRVEDGMEIEPNVIYLNPRAPTCG